MKKLAIFSDIHGNVHALKSIIEDIKKGNFDEIIFLGDMVGIGPNSKACVDLLSEANIKVIKGNHEIYQTNEDIASIRLTEDERRHRNWIYDQLDDKNHAYLEKLPMSLELLIEGKLFSFSHFFLGERGEYYESLKILASEKQFEVSKKIEADYMFIGHSHNPFQINNGSVITCVGSSGCTKGNTTYYTIVEVSSKDIKISKKELEYDRTALEQEIKKTIYPNREKVTEIFFGYKLKK